jgi:hypothetical protein
MSLWHEGSEDPMHKEMFLFVLDDVQVVPLSEVSPPKGQHRRKGFLSR